jgi:hypothetical protein
MVGKARQTKYCKGSTAKRVSIDMLMAFWGAGSGFGQMQTFCSGSGGNYACTSYAPGGSSQSFCSSIGGSLSCTTFENVTNTSQITVQDNYQAGAIVGEAIGGVVMAAIEAYREHKEYKRAKQEAWHQRVQDRLAKAQLTCEMDPKHDMGGGPGTIEECRVNILGVNLFLQRHEKDFVMDANNMTMLADAELRLVGTPT